MGLVIAIAAITGHILNSEDSQQIAILNQSKDKTISLSEKKLAIMKNDNLNAKAKRKLIAQLDGKLKAKTPYDQPKQAKQFYRRKRANIDNEIPIENYIEASPRFADKISLSGIIASTTSANDGTLFSAVTDAHVWSNIGPGNVGGRTRAILVQGTNPTYTIYAGGVAGGVWKSTDSGASWTALNDLMPNLAVTTLALDPSNDQIIYAGTGEGFSNVDSVRGAGIFKTIDGGANWTYLSMTNTDDFYYINKIVASPTNPNTVYAATRSGIFKSTDAGASWTWATVSAGSYSSNSGYLDIAVVDNGGNDYLYAWNSFYGLQRSTDGGLSWSYSIGTGATGNNNFYRGAIAVSKSAFGTAYVSVSDNTGRLYNVYKTTDYFASVSTPMTQGSSATGRLNAALLSNPYYSYDTGSGLTCANEASGGYSQGWYDNIIAVDPIDENKVFIGGIDLFRSDNGGTSFNIASYWWANTANSYYNHADHHAIVFAPDYNGTSITTMFFGNDGGIYKSTNAHSATTSTSVCSITDIGASYQSLNNGYGVTQFYHGSVSSSGTVYIAGSQDNGTQKFDSSTDWNEIRGGDGGYTAISPNNSNIMYSAYTYISIQRSDDGGANFSTSVASSNSGLFINPYAIVPDTPSTMYLTNQYLWRSTNVESATPTWIQLGYLGGNNGSAIGVPPKDYSVASSSVSDQRIQYASFFFFDKDWNTLYAIAVFVFVLILTFLMHIKTKAINSLARWGVVLSVCCVFGFLAGCAEESGSGGGTGPNTEAGAVYVGTEDGKFFALVNDSLLERTTGLPAGYISSVTVHPTNDSIVYVTFSTFGVSHLWKTTNAGGTWTDLDGADIPDIPAHSLFIDPNNADHLYLGTDLGVLYSGDGGSTWESINTEGMANVVVEHLDYQHSTRKLFAFTHGRGVFQVTLP